MKILVLATNYSRPDGFVSSQYIHSRNKIYVRDGLDVSVVSFGAQEDYILEGVKVFTLESYKKRLIKKNFDLLVSHAPNIKHHYIFLKKYGGNFKQFVFFFHGHEVLKYSDIYPEPYKYNNKNRIKKIIMWNLYDSIKFRIWSKYFPKIIYKSNFVFVSNWMYQMFTKYVKMDQALLENKKSIIYNCIGHKFETESYKITSPKKYDFITIRNLLDESKYAIDIVKKIAENNPQYNFCIAGKGRFFKVNKKPKNVILIEQHLNHNEILDLLNKSKIALMPTRADAQGVMACEMASFGIPLITSNIDVSVEIFNEFINVSYIDNNSDQIDISSKYNELLDGYVAEKVSKYFSLNTIEREIELFESIVVTKEK